LILGLEIQTNCKNWVWKENPVDPSMRSHCRIKKNLNSENVKNKECVHTWANSTSHIYYTLLWQVLGFGVQIQRPKPASEREREREREIAREKRHRRGAQGLDDLDNPAAAADHHV
jgi:hypothetical protein